MIPVGLRIDVDTLRGTRIGVPNLVRLLNRHQVKATFFFSVGPDNMGRHLWRLARPTFLKKMVRTRATALYGWDILLRGTLLPGPIIGKRCASQIQSTAQSGHEIGLHAWDHHRWQTRIERMDEIEVNKEIEAGWRLLSDIIGRAPECMAAPAWRITSRALKAREHFPCRFNSDCRGQTIFKPVIEETSLSQAQIPATLPTYDEMIGRCCTPGTYNETLLSMITPRKLNVLTLHAEVEGIACLPLFEDFLKRSRWRQLHFVSLGNLLTDAGELQEFEIERKEIEGREGWVSFQAKQ